MEEVKLNLNEEGRGAFYIMDGKEQLGEMVVGESDNRLVVYHTEVEAQAEGKGFAKMMLNAMVDYARQKHLMVIPYCSYVHAQFKRHPEQYTDVWKGDEDKEKDKGAK